MTNPILKFIPLFAAFFLFFSCTKESVVDPPTEIEEEKSYLETIPFDHPTLSFVDDGKAWLSWQQKIKNAFSEESVDEQNFIWNALNVWYFWKAQVPELDEEYFLNLQEYLDFLKRYTTPEGMVDRDVNSDALIYSEDRFTSYRMDYNELLESFRGINKSDGLEFGLFLDNSNQVIMYTQYTAKGSSAETAGIKRGDLFNRINGEVLTYSNWRELINNRPDSYSLGRAEQDATGAFVSIEEEVSLTQIEDFPENPVLHHSIFNNGSQKVGYLVYNQFIPDYNQELNEVFNIFKTNAIDELIIDLRYNPGGYTSAATLLASLIYDGEGVFYKSTYNPFWNSYYGSSRVSRFVNKASDLYNDQSFDLNRLGMKRVYILGQYGTASSSELLINGLKPYINVILVGQKTRGKNEFSRTLVDDPQGLYIYNPDRVDEINPNNKLAIQPIIGRNENSVGFFDYTDGFTPDIPSSEVEREYDNGPIYLNIGDFGTMNDDMFAKAIEHMSGSFGPSRSYQPSRAPVDQLKKEKDPLMIVEFE